ncbi:MAG: hypothetical protein ACRD3E_10710 [Terriglobales bacterium]
MKLGVENRNTTIAACVLAAIALFMVWRSFFSGGPAVSSPPPAPVQLGSAATTPRPATKKRSGQKQKALPAENPLDPRLRLALLKTSEDTEYQGSGRNIFRAEAEPVIPPAISNGVKEADKTPLPGPRPPSGPPPAPPLPFKAFGMATRAGMRQVFLAKGDDVFVAKEGDVVDRHYKIVKINPNSVEIEDLFSNNRQTIPVTAGQS